MKGPRVKGSKGESGNKTKRWSAMVDGRDSVSWQGQDVVHALLFTWLMCFLAVSHHVVVLPLRV